MTHSPSEALPVLSRSAPITADDVAALTGLKRPKWQRFVASYASGATIAAAVQSAGYGSRKPLQYGQKLLTRKPEVAAALAKVRQALAERSAFTMDRAMEQLREDRAFAIRTDNAAAAVRASELMAKMSGHLVERIDARIAVGFSVALFIPPREGVSG
ncbi:MAG: terminase small subunit [Steroidobacteraceae bacterium]